MKNWNDFIEEEVSAKHHESVMAAASSELKKRKPRREFIWGGLSLGLAAVAASFFAVVMRKTVEPEPAATPDHFAMQEMRETDIEDLKDLDLVANLEILEDLEVLEKWEPS